MNLILSGGGNAKQSQAVDTLFTKKLVNNKILYIPIAMDEQEHSYPECLEWCKNSLSVYGQFQIEMWTEPELVRAKYSDLAKFGGVFIGGGNTFYLLSEIRKSGFDRKLVKLLTQTDIPVIGGSAGALIFSESIDTAIPDDKNSTDLQNLDGLQLTNGYHLWVHYEPKMNDLIDEYVRRLSTRIIAKGKTL